MESEREGQCMTLQCLRSSIRSIRIMVTDWEDKSLAYIWEYRRNIQAQMDLRARLAEKPTKIRGVKEKK
jgi:hypothetical protein